MDNSQPGRTVRDITARRDTARARVRDLEMELQVAHEMDRPATVPVTAAVSR